MFRKSFILELLSKSPLLFINWSQIEELTISKWSKFLNKLTREFDPQNIYTPIVPPNRIPILRFFEPPILRFFILNKTSCFFAVFVHILYKENTLFFSHFMSFLFTFYTKKIRYFLHILYCRHNFKDCRHNSKNKEK